MATVVPEERNDFMGNLLQLAQQISGNRQFDQQLKLEKEKLKFQQEQAPTSEERSATLEHTRQTIKYLQEQALTLQANRKIEDEMLETERQLKVAQAAGMKAQALELTDKHDALAGMSPEERKSYYLQGVLAQENNKLRVDMQIQGQVLEAIKANLQQKQNDIVNQRNWFETQFGPDIRSASGTPFSGEVNSTSRTLADLLQSPNAQPEQIEQARGAHNDALKRLSDYQANMSLEKVKAEASVKQMNDVSSMKLSAQLANEQAIMKQPDKFAGGKTGQAYTQYMAAIAKNQVLGVDFDLVSKNTSWFSWMPFDPKQDYQFEFVPINGKTPTGPVLPTAQQKADAARNQ